MEKYHPKLPNCIIGKQEPTQNAIATDSGRDGEGHGSTKQLGIPR